MLFRFLAFAAVAAAELTIYNTLYQTLTNTAASTTATVVASQDNTILTPPSPPGSGEISSNVAVQLWDGGVDNLSQQTKGDFLGFSIEMSVFEQLFGSNETTLRPELLNYFAAISARSGSLVVRVGGNTQDNATIVDSLPNGALMVKEKNANNTAITATPTITFTPTLLKIMAAYSTLININYFFGVPFLKVNTDGNAAVVVQTVNDILGDKLLAYQLSNEPDLYGAHQKKSLDYGEQNFFDDTAKMIQSVPLGSNSIMGPSVCCLWTPQDVFNNGYLTQFAEQLKYISLMKYPNDNCNGDIVYQEVYANYLTHKAATTFVAQFTEPVGTALAAGKPVVLLETNTASCGGFPGVSDSFGATLWGIDMALQMVYNNYTNALWHVGGQNVYYNPFTPPPGGTQKFRKWTTGAIYYSNLFVAEALGKSGVAQVADLNLNNGNIYQVGYAIYESGVASRVALINFVTDSSGASDYTANVQIGGNGMPETSPSQVFVKYLSADTVSQKFNITWANQTMATDRFTSDGTLSGDLNVVTIQCSNNICPVPMKAPSAALVFLTQSALTESNVPTTGTYTFTTSTGSTLNIDMASVAVSNGRNGQLPLGSTSSGGSTSNAGPRTHPIARWTISASSLFLILYSILY